MVKESYDSIIDLFWKIVFEKTYIFVSCFTGIKQKLHHSDRKKRHVQKTQIAADKSGRKIRCTAFDKGRKHDFKLFKNSKIYLK